MSLENTGNGTAAAAAPADAFDDATIAEVLQAIETLTSVFQFDPDVAQQAVEAVGTDPTTCYNYILDKGLAADKGGAIYPIDNCPHVQHHVKVSIDQLPSPLVARCDHHLSSLAASSKQPQGGAKQVQEDDGACPPGENWVCLECCAIRCSRYINGHGVVHYKDTLQSDPGVDHAGHCIAISLADLSVWCHACNAYLKDPMVDALAKKLEQLKFGEGGTSEPSSSQHDDSAGAAADHHHQQQQQDEDSLMPLQSNSGEPHGGMHVEEEEEELRYEQLDYPFGSCPKSLKDVAEFIKSENCQSIAILAGAGMSVSSGIPDFRSEGGLYDTLQPELLTATEVEREAMRVDPCVALEQGLFLQNQLPCLELLRPFIMGTKYQTWKATLAHRFVELLHHKTGKLTRLYTQNIDGLESQCNLPHDKVIAVHGSFDRAECALCGEVSDFDEFSHVLEKNIKDIRGEDPNAPKESTPIPCYICGYHTVKPSVVLFRSPLPQAFFDTVPKDIPHVDLLIVIGTSLGVAPANTLVFRCPPSAMRVVVNREPVGYHLGIDYSDSAERDYFAQGDCDAVLLDLMEELGWSDELRPLLAADGLPASGLELLKTKLGTSSDTTI